VIEKEEKEKIKQLYIQHNKTKSIDKLSYI